MPRLIAGAMLLLILAVACQPERPLPSALPSVVPTTTAAPAVPSVSPTIIRSPALTATITVPVVGIPEVDAVLAGVVGRDTKALAALVHYAEVPCADRPGLGGPPTCDELGIPKGTPIQTLPTASCEGYFVPKPQVTESLSNMLGDKAPQLTFSGIYVPTKHPFGPSYAKPDYVVLFQDAANPDRGYRAVYLDEGGIVLVRAGCGQRMPQADEVERWLIEPPAPTIHTNYFRSRVVVKQSQPRSVIPREAGSAADRGILDHPFGADALSEIPPGVYPEPFDFAQDKLRRRDRNDILGMVPGTNAENSWSVCCTSALTR